MRRTGVLGQVRMREKCRRGLGSSWPKWAWCPRGESDQTSAGSSDCISGCCCAWNA